MPDSTIAEMERLLASQRREANWLRWGPYLSERQWGTVREDYSGDGNSWAYFPHDHARSRAYRWGEDGLLGISDRQCRLCFSIALWNGRDPILKERLYGLNGPEGNHGEDVKECYYYLDSSPTHSYLHGLYKYPVSEFPYSQLIEANRHRSRDQREYELVDTGVFDAGYFDVDVEYAKAGPDDILVEIHLTLHADAPETLHVLPHYWFRNTWTWECTEEGCTRPPRIWQEGAGLRSDHETLGRFQFFVDDPPSGPKPQWLVTGNETNPQRHPGIPTTGTHFKDAFHRFVVEGQADAVASDCQGTKAAAHCVLELQPGQRQTIRCRITAESAAAVDSWQPFGAAFDQVMDDRRADCDAFYATRIDGCLSDDRKAIMRQAYAGLLWTKQFYHYSVKTWLEGDTVGPEPPASRRWIRNGEWQHLFNRDVLSMPDKWEYPWYAVWDSAFHMIPFARLDADFAKQQLLLFLREWYMHPNGQIPAYEWNFSDVNPPVHAWAVWEVYKATGAVGERDKLFLAQAFQKLVINFTWWVNRKDPRGRNVFNGGFLGLDNIGVFDRSQPLPGGVLEQADATAWMAFYCGAMLRIALELADGNPAYGDMASKFFEHYVAIAEAMNTIDGTGLWEEDDGFYYDHVYFGDHGVPMRIRSLVGLLPLMTGVILRDAVTGKLPGFRKRMEWFLKYRGDLSAHMTWLECDEAGEHGQGNRFLAIPSPLRFRRLLTVMLDENEFLSPYGIRSLSAAHRHHPFEFELNGHRQSVHYVPGESNTGMFGGNSNWRGPVWLPMNYLITQSLRRYHAFYGDRFKIECPTGSGNEMNLLQVAQEIERRLIGLFENSDQGRPAHGGDARYRDDPHWNSLVLFYEYFHGDDGTGLGASHQTGWTALVASILEHTAKSDCPETREEFV